MRVPRHSWVWALPLCLAAGCKESGPASPTTETRQFSSSAPVEVIADAAAFSGIEVDGFEGTITGLEIAVDFTSLTGTVCEWGVSVRHPDGTAAGLMSPEVPTCGTSLVTTFPTETVPLRSLDTFHGRTVEGRWQLDFGIEDGSVHDAVRHRIRLNGWTLTITVER